MIRPVILVPWLRWIFVPRAIMRVIGFEEEREQQMGRIAAGPGTLAV
jgi:hypothetical protein